MKHLLIIVFVLSASHLMAQNGTGQSIVSFSYTGGFFIHPGFSLEYHRVAFGNNKLDVRPGIKVGAYFHRRYQNALFVLPEVQLLKHGRKNRLIGLSLQAGFQRHFIPNTYVYDNSKMSLKKESSGTSHFVFGPGLILGKTLNSKSGRPIELVVHPQLQFRKLHGNSSEYRIEKYILGSVSINYPLIKN